MGSVAAEIISKRASGLRAALGNLDNLLLRRALRGAGSTAGQEDLLSYLLFDGDYLARSIELGCSAAARAVAGGWDT